MKHTDDTVGNFMDDLRDDFFERQPKEVKEYYERISRDELETELRRKQNE